MKKLEPQAQKLGMKFLGEAAFNTSLKTMIKGKKLLKN